MKRLCTYLLLGIIFASCQKEYEAPIPKLTWSEFESPGAVWLSKTAVSSFDGVYNVTEGSDVFGSQVAVKSSYVITGTDTTFHVSFFCGTDISWFICQGKSLDSSVLLNGYWRRMINTETGTSRFTINWTNGARQILDPNPVVGADSITIEGVYGDNVTVPDKRIVMKYNRPLRNRGFQILAHRGGGRTSDLLNVSENSLEMIRFAEQLGSTGVEIDVRLTSDKVPILYHDNTINNRLIEPNGMTGPIENYSYLQLHDLTRLIYGEKMPTLREALDVVVYQTNLQFVWLDTKYSGDLGIMQLLQEEYLQKAVAAGRTLEICIGLPTDDQLVDFKRLTDYVNVPSLCELTRDNVREVNAKVWAPRWTLGTQNSEVDGVHAEGRKVFTWTMDVPQYIDQFITQGKFDGILSNYPSIVAYYEYTK